MDKDIKTPSLEAKQTDAALPQDPGGQENRSTWKKPQIGGFWARQSKASGRKYLSGIVNITDDFGKPYKIKVVMYPNRHKKEDRHFDYCLYLDENKVEAAVKSDELDDLATANENGSELI